MSQFGLAEQDPIWDDRKQCLHDKAASTIVVRA
jgi:hypothetical protein